MQLATAKKYDTLPHNAFTANHRIPLPSFDYFAGIGLKIIIDKLPVSDAF